MDTARQVYTVLCKRIMNRLLDVHIPFKVRVEDCMNDGVCPEDDVFSCDFLVMGGCIVISSGGDNDAVLSASWLDHHRNTDGNLFLTWSEDAVASVSVDDVIHTLLRQVLAVPGATSDIIADRVWSLALDEYPGVLRYVREKGDKSREQLANRTARTMGDIRVDVHCGSSWGGNITVSKLGKRDGVFYFNVRTGIFKAVNMAAVTIHEFTLQ